MNTHKTDPGFESSVFTLQSRLPFIKIAHTSIHHLLETVFKSDFPKNTVDFSV